MDTLYFEPTHRDLPRQPPVGIHEHINLLEDLGYSVGGLSNENIIDLVADLYNEMDLAETCTGRWGC